MTTTQFAQASYQEVIDLHTEANTVSFMGIHTPIGEKPYLMLKGFFDQFRKYKYNGCRFSLVPAARLPADPLQVSYESGEATLDPRDLMNPIIGKGCHGDNLGTILNTMYGTMRLGVNGGFKFDITPSINMVSVAQGVDGSTVEDSPYTDLYYSALTDKTWLKAHPQAGMRKSGLRPLIYSVGSTVPLGVDWLGTEDDPAPENPDFGSYSVRDVNSSTGSAYGISGAYTPDPPRIASNRITTEWSSLPGLITPKLQSLGWLDTQRYLRKDPIPTTTSVDDLTDINDDLRIALGNYVTDVNPLPKVFMYMLGLPPAYKHEQYYRLIIDHQFSFKQFKGASQSNVVGVEDAYFNFN